jgi:hypothetical protein
MGNFKKLTAKYPVSYPRYIISPKFLEAASDTIFPLKSQPKSVILYQRSERIHINQKRFL